MNKRLMILLLVFVIIISSVVACSKSGDKTEAETTMEKSEETKTESEEPAKEEPMGENVLYWNVGSDPKTIDPCLNSASDGGNIINNTFEGLVREVGGEVLPGIAESWEMSEDGKTITFKLRESKWSDGSPLTAKDFEYAWKRGMDPATASEYAWIWEYTNVVGALEATQGGSLDDVGVKALDDYTLEVKLTTPTDYVLSLFSFFHFMPVKEEAVAKGADGAWAKDPNAVVCNGPFKLSEYTIGEGLKLVKNENYWKADEVKLDVIDGKFIDEASTAFQAYQSGDLDFIPSVPTSEVQRLIAEDPNFHILPILGTYYYNFNLDLDLFSDVRVRKAFALAIDRQKICDTLGTGQVPATGFTPPGFVDSDGKDFFEVAGEYFAVDGSGVEEAKALLAEAGYPNGEGFPEFTLMYNTSEGHQQVAELIQEMFKTNLGINCKLENQEWAVFQVTRTERNYEMARGGWLTDFMDPMGMLGIFVSGNIKNYPNYSNEEFDALLKTANSTTGKEHFDALYEAQAIMMSEYPIIPIYHYTEYYLIRETVKDWARSSLGSLDFSKAYVGK